MLKINKNYVLREVAGEAMAVPTGNAVKNHNGIFLLTETGAFLWKLIENGTPENELVNKLTEEFDVPPETAQKDLDSFIKKLTDLKILTSE